MDIEFTIHDLRGTAAQQEATAQAELRARAEAIVAERRESRRRASRRTLALVVCVPLALVALMVLL